MASKKRYCITASAFDKRGRLIASANNSYKDSCSLMRYYAMKTGNFQRVFNHAEVHCLAKAMKMNKVVDTLVIVRYDCSGRMKDSRPCEICQEAISDFKVRKVIYSTPNGMEELK